MVSSPAPPLSVSLPPAPIITLALPSPVSVSLLPPPPILEKLEALAKSELRLNVVALLIDSLVQQPAGPLKTKVLEPEPPLTELSSERLATDV